ncbi:helix-turn-helix transcriptional regulator [Brevundimonas nasdae]|uniref:helix-turn-helix domain-containing protein n=2 Tax=Brevundimonas nasdae TaxID=172043 RepID=UPI0019138554|nr:helix-turn-helix transcriptional regulator [Brevundimonas nasdae]
MLEPSQIRMARAALKISVRELAKMTGVADSTILRFESGKGAILTTNMKRMQEALEAAGVTFVPADSSGGPGVRLKT